MDLVSRLKQYLDSRQISVTQFADECSIPRPTGSQLLAGRNKKVSDEIISKIHLAYPDLSIVWLMFGEGDMVTNANIKTSEPQNSDNQPLQPSELNINQEFTTSSGFANTISENESEKNSDVVSSGFGFPTDIHQPSVPSNPTETVPGNTFSFTPNPSTSPLDFQPTQATQPNGPQPDSSYSASTEKKDSSITFTPGKGKRVTGIVVYYDDSTYESFIPDPSHRHPFMR